MYKLQNIYNKAITVEDEEGIKILKDADRFRHYKVIDEFNDKSADVAVPAEALSFQPKNKPTTKND